MTRRKMKNKAHNAQKIFDLSHYNKKIHGRRSYDHYTSQLTQEGEGGELMAVSRWVAVEVY